MASAATTAAESAGPSAAFEAAALRASALKAAALAALPGAIRAKPPGVSLLTAAARAQPATAVIGERLAARLAALQILA
jgi:hypothetical protein